MHTLSRGLSAFTPAGSKSGSPVTLQSMASQSGIIGECGVWSLARWKEPNWWRRYKSADGAYLTAPAFLLSFHSFFSVLAPITTPSCFAHGGFPVSCCHCLSLAVQLTHILNNHPKEPREQSCPCTPSGRDGVLSLFHLSITVTPVSCGHLWVHVYRKDQDQDPSVSLSHSWIW